MNTMKLIAPSPGQIAVLDINKKDKGLVIGKEGKNIDRIKNLLKRHHNLDDIMIM